MVKKFVTVYQEWITQHGLAERAFLLQQTATYPLSHKQAVEYEWIDQMKIEGLQYADRNSRKLSMGEVPWSPQLQIL